MSVLSPTLLSIMDSLKAGAVAEYDCRQTSEHSRVQLFMASAWGQVGVRADWATARM